MGKFWNSLKGLFGRKAAAEPAKAAAPAQAVSPNQGPSRTDLLYYLEHQFMPRVFFNPSSMLAVNITSQKDHIYTIAQNQFKDRGVDFPYKPEDFKFLPYKMSENVFMIQQDFPEPESPALCYSCFMFFDTEFAHPAFFTLEKSIGFGGSTDPILCGWSAEQSHLNFGPIALDNDVVIKRCIEIYVASLHQGENAPQEEENDAEN